jgi:hypothetical protein
VDRIQGSVRRRAGLGALLAIAGIVLATAGCQTAPGDPNKNPYQTAGNMTGQPPSGPPGGGRNGPGMPPGGGGRPGGPPAGANGTH